MAIDMLVHDMRLKGPSPRIAANIWEVDSTVPIQHIADWSGEVARESGSLNRYVIMAHGYEDTNGHGGFGIVLGKEDLTLVTVSCFETLRGYVDRIILFSCAAADVAPGANHTNGDGAWLCTQLAVMTQAKVIASSATQYYSNTTFWGGVSPIDFGDWEGDVFEFSPNGNKRLLKKGGVFTKGEEPRQDEPPPVQATPQDPPPPPEIQKQLDDLLGPEIF